MDHYLCLLTLMVLVLLLVSTVFRGLNSPTSSLSHGKSQTPNNFRACGARFSRFLWAALSLCTLFWRAAGVLAAEPQVPEGFRPLDSGIGVQLYRKEYNGGSPDYVQVIDLSQGAVLKLMHGSISQPRPGRGVYGGDDPRMTSLPLQEYWSQVSAQSEYAFCVTNGSFFYMPEYPTRLAFPLKVDGNIVTDGWGNHTHVGEHLMLELWEDHADIREQNKDTLYSSSAPNIVASLSEHANKNAKKTVGRTFVGIDDPDQDGVYEILLLFNTRTATQVGAAEVLRKFGADKVMMLDGGGSTQLLCKSDWYLRSERLIPQAIGVIAGSPPPVATELLHQPQWPISLAGEHFPLGIKIKNTGIESWAPGETQLVIEKSSLGGLGRLDFEDEIKPGETAVFTHTLAAFTQAGVYPVQLSWSIAHGGETYPGEPIELDAIVLPEELADRRGELQEQVQVWMEGGQDGIEGLAAEWIQEQSVARMQTVGPKSLDEVNLNDVVLIPLIMLPVILILATVIGRGNRGD